MGRRLRALLCLFVVLVLIAAAGCADRDDSGDEVGSDEPTEEGGDDGGGDGDAFGDLEENPCGPAEGSEETPLDDAAETQGVSADAIQVGTVSDPGFEGRPGLNQEMFDAGEAFVAWCNEQGGIDGHQIELTLYDAAITQYQQRLMEACDQEFAMVGGGSVSDNVWTTTAVPCGLVDVAGYSVTPEKAGTSGSATIEENRTVQPVPNASDQYLVGAQAILAEEFPDAADQAGIVYGDLATLQVQKDRQIEAQEQIGYEFVLETSYNILGEANWAPFAQAISDDEVDYLTFVGEGENMANLQIALADLGYEPEVTQVEANLYDPNYLDAAGDAAEGTFVRTAFWPFEEADENPATQQYIDLVEEQGGKIALLGAQSWSAWLLFATLASECSQEGELTRSCILEKGGETTGWTGGGLHAPTNPGENEGSPCTIVLQVQDGEFVRFAPEDPGGGEGGFACAEDGIADLEGDYSSSG